MMINPDSRGSGIALHGRLKVSQNRRFLVHEDGAPFFWLGDTAWELFHRLNLEDTDLYLSDRAEKGFSVIQAVVLAEMDGLHIPNAYGYNPFYLDDAGIPDPSKPVEAYFAHVDAVVDMACQKGLVIGMLPTWGDKVNKRYEWAAGPEIFTSENAFFYGRWIADRYKDRPNIVWIVGGDRNPDERGIAIWRAMAGGIRAGAGKHKPLMTFHPQPFDGGSSSTWFHEDDWLDFNMLQTGHDRDTPVYSFIQHEYSLEPVKPVLDGEPIYEGHGIAFKPFEKGYSSDHDVRKMAYWDVFAGAFGHTYGCHSIWQFFSTERKGVNYPIYDWRDALHLAGAEQMRWLKKLICSRPILDRIPDQSMIAGNSVPGPDRIVATRS